MTETKQHGGSALINVRRRDRKIYFTPVDSLMMNEVKKAVSFRVKSTQKPGYHSLQNMIGLFLKLVS